MWPGTEGLVGNSVVVLEVNLRERSFKDDNRSFPDLFELRPTTKPIESVETEESLSGPQAVSHFRLCSLRSPEAEPKPTSLVSK